MKTVLAWLGVATAALLAACGSGSAPSDTPQNVTVTPGDGRVVLTWTQDPSRSYWIFYVPGSTVAFPGSTGETGYRSVVGANSPQSVLNLTNGTQYALIMAQFKDGSKAGPTTPVLTATPRPAGAT